MRPFEAPGAGNARSPGTRERIGIVGGAGTVGSTMAFALGSQNAFEEIVLVDVRQNVLRAQVMDLEHAVAPISTTKITPGAFDDLRRCGIVIVAASAPETGGADRVRFLAENASIVHGIAGELRAACPTAVIVNATNPVDPLTFMLWRETGLPRERFLGFSLNDSWRFRCAIARVLDIAPARIEALAIGEHGPKQVLLFSTVTIDGSRTHVSASQESAVRARVGSWFHEYTALRSGRTSGWTSAVSALTLVDRIIGGSADAIAASVVTCGEYGFSDLSIGLPVRLCRSGVESIVSLELTDREVTELDAAASAIRELITRSITAPRRHP